MAKINFAECLYFSSGRFNRIIAQMSDREFKKLGLSSTAAFILMSLEDNDALNPSEIADQLSLDRSTITRFLDKLQRDGLIIRTSEGRKVTVVLTEQGTALQPQLKQLWSQLNEAYQRVLGVDVEERIRTELNAEFDKLMEK